MGIPCDVCQKSFASERSLRRHRKDIHNISSKNVPLECNECGFRAPSMVGMRRHCQTEHGNNAIKECVYCRMAFISEEKFREHMKNQHELPDFQSFGYTGPLPTQTALRCNLKVVQLPVGGNELDLLDYLSNQKSEIQTIVKDQARSGPVKVGMSACVKMLKDLETSIDEDGRQKRIEFWTNTQMQLIYPGNGLPDDEYWASVEKLLNCVTTFTLEGSGWRFESLSRFEIKFARFAPIRPGSYIALPPKYESEQSLLNIRN